MTKDEKIQRLQGTISSFERLLRHTQGKIVKLEQQLKEEVERRKEYERLVVPIPEPTAEGAPTEEVVQDLALHHHQDLTRAKKDENEPLTAESDGLQDQITHLQTELEKSAREVGAKAQEIAKKEDELKEMRERLEEQEAKREESQRKCELLEKAVKQEAPSAKATQDLDMYFTQLLKITEELTDLKVENEKQKKALDRLKNLEKRAEEMEEENVEAATELSRQEKEIKHLQKEIQVQQFGVSTEVAEEGAPTHMVKQERRLQQKVRELEEKLKGKDEEIETLKKGISPISQPLGEGDESLMSSVTDVHVASLRKKLQEKEQEVQNLKAQVRSVAPALHEKDQLLRQEREKLTQEKKTLVDHSKKQSKTVRDLKQQLETTQVGFCSLLCLLWYAFFDTCTWAIATQIPKTWSRPER